MRRCFFLRFSIILFTVTILTTLWPSPILSFPGKTLVLKNNPEDEEALLALTLGNLNVLDQIELEEARELLREDKAIKFGKLFNFFFSKFNFWNELDIKDIVLFQIDPIYTAAKKTVDLIGDSRELVSGWRDISIRERKALVRYEHFLRKYPHSKYAPVVQKKLEKLKTKKIRHDYLRELKLAKQALKAEDFLLAKKHYQKALKLSPATLEEVSSALDRLAGLEKSYLAKREPLDLVKLGGEVFLHPGEKDNYEELLLSLTTHDANALLLASKEFIQNSKNGPLRDEAEISAALALEFKEDLTQAKKVFSQVKDKYPKSNMGRYARIIVDNPHYDLYTSIKNTVKNKKKDTIKYVLLGDASNPNLPKEGVTGWAKRAYHLKENQKEISSPNRIIGRAFEVFVQKKVPTNQTIISLGEGYLKKYPGSKRAPEVRKIVAQAYEKQKLFNAALFHYNLSGSVTGSKLKELEDKAAIDLLQGVTEDKKDLYYANILELYPRSDAAHLIRKYANNKGAGGIIGKKEKTTGINFEMFPGSAQMMPLLGGGNSWLIKTSDNIPLAVSHPLLGLNLNFDRRSDTSLNRESTPKFFGLLLLPRKEWVKEDKYSMGYQLWDEKQYAMGKLSLNQWGATAQMGVNKKGPNTQIHLPIPIIKNFIPLALRVRAKLGMVQFLPVMEDIELEDAALYQD